MRDVREEEEEPSLEPPNEVDRAENCPVQKELPPAAPLEFMASKVSSPTGLSGSTVEKVDLADLALTSTILSHAKLLLLWFAVDATDMRVSDIPGGRARPAADMSTSSVMNLDGSPATAVEDSPAATDEQQLTLKLGGAGAAAGREGGRAGTLNVVSCTRMLGGQFNRKTFWFAKSLKFWV